MRVDSRGRRKSAGATKPAGSTPGLCKGAFHTAGASGGAGRGLPLYWISQLSRVFDVERILFKVDMNRPVLGSRAGFPRTDLSSRLIRSLVLGWSNVRVLLPTRQRSEGVCRIASRSVLIETRV